MCISSHICVVCVKRILCTTVPIGTATHGSLHLERVAMTDMTASAAPPNRGDQKTIPALKAFLTPLDRRGHYLIEVAGVSIKSRYPANRLAKVLSLAGLTGKLDIYGPSADGKRTILRLTVDIEKYGSRQMAETDADGFRWLAWTERSLVPLHDAAARLKRSLVDAQGQVARGEGQREAGTALPAQSFRKTADHGVDKRHRENALEGQS